MSSIALEFREIIRALESKPYRKLQSECFDIVQFCIKRMPFAIDPEKVIVVAGSNGKGSVCATLESLLKASGQRVGTMISPHLVSATERIRMDGQEISRTLFCSAYRWVEKEFEELKLTYIETITLMGLWIFFSESVGDVVDYAIVEVSVGGLWDVANAIPHRNCVVTRLGIDHEKRLGSTLLEIAKHKFGIIGRKAKVVYLQVPDELRPLVSAIQEKNKGSWVCVEDVDFEVIYRKRDVVFSAITEWGNAALALPGRRGVENTMLALKMFEALGYEPKKHLAKLQRIKWPGRMQRIEVPEADCPVFLSGDHNVQGLESLFELLEYYPRKQLHLLVALGADRDLDKMMQPLFELKNTSVHITRSPYKGLALRAYKNWYRKAAGVWVNPVVALKNIAKKAEREDLIVVTGSLYLVGKIASSVKNTSTSHFSKQAELHF